MRCLRKVEVDDSATPQEPTLEVKSNEDRRSEREKGNGNKPGEGDETTRTVALKVEERRGNKGRAKQVARTMVSGGRRRGGRRDGR